MLQSTAQLSNTNQRAKLLASAILATCAPSVFAATTIPSLPATLSKAGETYILSSDLNFTGSGSAISITASNITLDGGGRTIRYCDTSTSCTGIRIGGVSGTTIRNLSLQQGTSTSGAATAIGGTAGTGTLVDSVKFNLVARPGAGTFGVNVAASGAGSELRSSVFNISGNDAIESVNNSGSAAWQVHDNTWNVTSLTYTSTYPRLINVGTLSQYYNNTITVDSKSRYINLFISWQQRDVKIYSNRINFASQHGRIFHLDDSTSGFEIHDNHVTVTSQNEGQDTVYVFRLRSDAGHRGASNNKIHHNTIDATNSKSVLGISIGADTYANDNNDFSHNIISTPSTPIDFYGDYASNTAFYCNRINHTSSSGYPIYVLGSLHTGIRFENNAITTGRSDGVKLRFQQAQASSAQWTLVNTTISQAQISGNTATTSALFSTSLNTSATEGCATAAGARSMAATLRPAPPAGVMVQ